MAKKTLIGALAIVMASAIALPQVAFAAPLTQPNQSRAMGVTSTGDVNVEPVAWRKKRYGYNNRWRGDRYRYRHGGYRHYHNGWYYNSPWWLAAPLVGGALVGAYAAPRVYYDNDDYAGGGHVEWCMNRYRSYDPRSNTFVGYDGYRHECNSPFG
jgi:hypothetical protein